MSYATRSKDNPGDVGRAADQQQSVDNEQALFAALLGPAMTARPPGMLAGFIKKTGMVDNVATEFATVTTTNEAGSNDGGVWGMRAEGIVAHGVGPTLETSLAIATCWFAKALNGAGLGSVNVTPSVIVPFAASTPATKDIATVTFSIVETSEYVTSLRAQVDINGTTVTTAAIYLRYWLIYAGFTTEPVVLSA